MVRSFTLRDLALVRRLSEQGVSLHSESALADNLHPLRGALLNLVVGKDYPTLIWKSREGDRAGFIQLLLNTDRSHAHILYLSPSIATSGTVVSSNELSQVENVDAWLSLLDEAVRESGQFGIQSLIAEVDESGIELPLLRRAGFAIYARQDIWALARESTKPAGEKRKSRMRRRSDEDDWDIQLLYANTVPRLVRLVEPAPPGDASEVWVWRESSGELAAIVHRHEGELATWLRFYFHPQAEAESADVLRDVLAMGSRGAQRPTYCCVRRYEGWLPNVLQHNGFQLQGSQAVMVRHTVHHAQQKASSLRVSLENSGVPVSSPSTGRYPAMDLAAREAELGGVQ